MPRLFWIYGEVGWIWCVICAAFIFGIVAARRAADRRQEAARQDTDRGFEVIQKHEK